MKFDIIDTALQSLDGHEVNNDWRVEYDQADGTIALVEKNSSAHLKCTPFWECNNGIPVQAISPEEHGVYYDEFIVHRPQNIEEWNEFFDAYKNRYLLAIAQKYDRWYIIQKEIIMGHRIWDEVTAEHIDDQGVFHIDGYTNRHEDDNGRVIAYIINGQAYYKDDRAKTDKEAQRVIKEALARSLTIVAEYEGISQDLPLLEGERIWEEVTAEYVDGNGIIHIDGYTNVEGNGKVIAYVLNGKAYYKDDRAKTDKEAQRVIKEICLVSIQSTPDSYKTSVAESNEKPQPEGGHSPAWEYWIGSTKVVVNDLDEMRGLVEELYQLGTESGHDWSMPIHDFLFAIIVDYQSYYGLTMDDYSIVDENKPPSPEDEEISEELPLGLMKRVQRNNTTR